MILNQHPAEDLIFSIRETCAAMNETFEKISEFTGLEIDSYLVCDFLHYSGKQVIEGETRRVLSLAGIVDPETISDTLRERIAKLKAWAAAFNSFPKEATQFIRYENGGACLPEYMADTIRQLIADGV